MSKFFAKFPKIKYDIVRDGHTNNYIFTNVLLRIKILESVKQNVFAYYEYPVRNDETIEMLAEKYYGNPEYHWIVALTNDMSDPLFDWVMTYNVFQKYLIGKYGSIAIAQATTHHFEKIITRTINNTIDSVRIEIDEDTYDALPATSTTAYNLDDDVTTVHEVITKSAISCYDYEDETNEKKRSIKLIKKEYLGQILAEFESLVSETNARRNIRSLR